MSEFAEVLSIRVWHWCGPKQCDRTSKVNLCHQGTNSKGCWGIRDPPYTFVSSNFFAGYFLPILGQAGATDLPTDKVVILGDGNPKGNLFLKDILIELTVRNANWVVLFPSTAIFLNEDDIGTYTIKAVDDPRTLNKVLYLRPPANILSHNELVSLWEKKTGKTFERVYVPEEHVL